ncbi:hypothetical protein JAO73_10540 [Hymenobacter sp. BT523]|uniref:hypothetical protein n=1 Tax=Hymenobacter sp. BT523 TaxID=2795725 RepID=UPI0018EAC130|nr:hypothetical protein [Hymenobacter sp. BT523]MBJ6109453.1 hypothetical protein [Hymenobacter sp. BT523]
MAASNTPVPTQAALIPTVETWLADVNQRFADNKFGQTTELDFREVFAGAAQVFANWPHLSVKRVKGATYPVPYTDNLGLVPENYRILGMQAVAVNGVDSATGQAGVTAPPVYFTLLKNGQGPVAALVDTEPTTTTTVKAAWVQTSGTDDEKTLSYPVLPLEDAALDAGDVYQYTFVDLVPPVTRLVEVRNDLNQFQNPLPTGLDSDPYYKPFAPLTASTGYDDTQLRQLIGQQQPRVLSVAEARALDPNDVQPIRYRILRGVLGDVETYGLPTDQATNLPGAFAREVQWQDPADGLWTRKNYSLDTNTISDSDIEAVQAGLTSASDAVNMLFTGKVEVWKAGPVYANRVYLLIGGIGTGLYQPKNDIGSSSSVSLTFYNRLADFRYLPGQDVLLAAALKANNLSDLPSPAAAIANLGLPAWLNTQLNAFGVVSLVNETLLPASSGSNPNLRGVALALNTAYFVTAAAAAAESNVLRLLPPSDSSFFVGQPIRLRLASNAAPTTLYLGPGTSRPLDWQPGESVVLSWTYPDTYTLDSAGSGISWRLVTRSAGGGGTTTAPASTTYLVLESADPARVGKVPVVASFQITAEILDANVSGLTYQLDTNTRTSRVYGAPDQTRAQINAQLAALTPTQISEGTNLYWKHLPTIAANPSTAIIALT